MEYGLYFTGLFIHKHFSNMENIDEQIIRKITLEVFMRGCFADQLDMHITTYYVTMASSITPRF